MRRVTRSLRAMPRNAKRVGDIGGRGPTEQHGLLEDHGLTTPDLVIHRPASPKNDALGRLDQSVHQSKQQALSCAIRPKMTVMPRSSHLEVDAVDQHAVRQFRERGLSSSGNKLLGRRSPSVRAVTGSGLLKHRQNGMRAF